MNSRHLKFVGSMVAAAVLAVPAVAAAKHGADDPPGHVRHSSHATSAKQSARHSSTTLDDHGGRGGGHGSDDGPNHT